MTGRDRLLRAGYAPCDRCVWRRGEVERPCAYHLRVYREAHRLAWPAQAPRSHHPIERRRAYLEPSAIPRYIAGTVRRVAFA